MNCKLNFKLWTLSFFMAFGLLSFAQEVEILNYSTNINGQVELEVASSEEEYFILKVRHDPFGGFNLSTSMALGEEGTTVISEPLAAYPLDHYQVLSYPIDDPADTDGDGQNDVDEFNNMPFNSPINYAPAISFSDGSVNINSLQTFKQLSIDGQQIPWASFLNDKEFLKFVIVDINTPNPRVYFVNSITHYIHYDFMEAVGLDYFDDDTVKGEIIYHPTTVGPNGTLGVFTFNYSFGSGEDFNTTRKTNELLAANMPFLKNNFAFFVTAQSQWQYDQDQVLYEQYRVPVLFEADVYADIDYLALHVAEGFGFFRLMNLEDTPGSKDVVLYESLPNTLPRVGGIMTSFIQTPLSHVNLRAIQDDLPNAFIRDPLQIDSIANLLDKYVYYRVEQDEYFIREATLEEVNDWYEDIRPTDEQIPALNLSYQDILPLDEIEFGMSDGFGAKCTNVATMRKFGFPEGTIPDGFGVPFYFYQEFMEHNGFFDEIAEIISEPLFNTDLEYRIEALKQFRKDIKDGDMPQWMLTALQDMHDAFPEGTNVRCRSSTNNEDLPGFSGAGLYTSKTQYLDEGHISKSIKQVYASMWNFRAFDERDFYRVDQYVASMGVLCHPNYSDEKANGVGISTDPIYQTDETFYLNTQLGEDLVTNPDAFSIPEEILLDKVSLTVDDYIVIRNSNLVANGVLIMTPFYLDQMREFLNVIHDEFQTLYEAEGADGFAMDIEYKITIDDQLIIKQARPWAAFWSEVLSSDEVLEHPFSKVDYYPNPIVNEVNIDCDCEIKQLNIFNAVGQNMGSKDYSETASRVTMPVEYLQSGIYFVQGLDENGKQLFAVKLLKQ